MYSNRKKSILSFHCKYPFRGTPNSKKGFLQNVCLEPAVASLHNMDKLASNMYSGLTLYEREIVWKPVENSKHPKKQC